MTSRVVVQAGGLTVELRVETDPEAPEPTASVLYRGPASGAHRITNPGPLTIALILALAVATGAPIQTGSPHERDHSDAGR